MSGPGPDAAAEAAACFGLGDPLGGLQPVAGGGAHLMFRLRTTTGEWAVKRLNSSPEAWWLRDHAIAREIEAAARARGIAMPRAVAPLRSERPPCAEPRDGAVSSTDGPDVRYLVHEWCSGHPLDPTAAGTGVWRWAGETLAALHRLRIAREPADAESYEPHPVEEWTMWLAGHDGDLVERVRDRLPDIARARDLVGRARGELTAAGRLTPVFTHRDVKPDNILLTGAGPMLLDWDGAGIDVAQWEVVRSALAVGGGDKAAFRRIMAAYAEAGGHPVAPGWASFAGVLRLRLGAGAWMLWRALGHRPVTPPERAASARHVVDILDELRDALQRLDDWAEWLRP